ncbi:MAG: MotA/TolQ/ExbB proton channel family protein [Gammaproteobacteria bacterium]|nr:MAG: MotA/TolQ/ExbB proton channel family protein [Gammaproteobacteria bacterium]
MDFMNNIILFFQEGGFFMYPIAFVLAFGIAIAIERYVYLSASRRTNRKLVADLLPILKSGDFQKAYGMTSKQNNAVSRVINYGLTKIKTAKHRDDIEMAIEEGMMEIIPRLEKRTHYLAMFANIATLLGLLGTIMGLITAFTAVAKADPSQKADMLSGSISVAMNTTAFGLMAAIPLLLIYTVLQTKTTEIVDSLEMVGVKFVNSIAEKTSFGGK